MAEVYNGTLPPGDSDSLCEPLLRRGIDNGLLCRLMAIPTQSGAKLTTPKRTTSGRSPLPAPHRSIDVVRVAEDDTRDGA
jgi:hypothetical protein